MNHVHDRSHRRHAHPHPQRAARLGHRTVAIPGSKTKRRIAEILQQEGYIEGFEWQDDTRQGAFSIQLR